MTELEMVPGRPRGGVGAFQARKRTEIIQRRANVASLLLHHKRETEIAKALGVTQGCISMDIKMLKLQWEKEAAESIKVHQARLIAELDELTAECARHLHKEGRDPNLDSVWVVQWRTTLLEKAKVLGLIENKSAVDITSGGSRIGVREVVIELPPGNE
jgi:predicted transcriptional regulator